MIAFYISGHGFGHASRDVEIINAVAARRSDVRFLLRTSVAPWLLERTLNAQYQRDAEPCDTGVVQIDSLRLDARATIERARAFHAGLDRKAEREADVLRRAGASLVLADAPALACTAAARAGIPSVVIGNFTWDWIYAAYADELRSAPDLVPTVQGAYALAEEAWRMPMHGGFEAFTRIVDVPFVARHATHSRDDTLARLGLATADSGRKIALCSFGGYGVKDLDLASLDCLAEWDIVFTGSARPSNLSRGVRFFEEHEIYDSGVRYEDLVAAVDAVVTKPGYGIVSECIANRTAMVYTSRGHFAEYPVMVAEMSRYLRSAFLEQEALLAGRWVDALERVRRASEPLEHPPTNGADVIAEMIVARL